MPDYNFNEPVRVILGTVSYVVASTRQASEVLISKWPTEGGWNHDAARNALLAAMGEKRNGRLIRKARQAFIIAAAEADILMHDRPSNKAPFSRSLRGGIYPSTSDAAAPKIPSFGSDRLADQSAVLASGPAQIR